MDASAGPGQAVREAREARRRRVAVVLPLAVLVAFVTVALLISPLTGQASAHSPGDVPVAPADASPTATATPAGPPTLTLVSPSSGTGPVNAKLTVAGDNWSGAVNVGAILSPGDCSNKSGWAKSFGSPKANGAGHISFSFTWPTSLNQTSSQYYICATNASGTAPSVPFQVASPTAPAIAFSVNSAQVGVLLTINGSNFLGAGPITITAQGPQGSARLVTTVTPLDNGTFSVPFTPTVRDVGSVTVRATSASEGGAPSAIATSSKLVVVAAPTATATLAPTPTTATGGVIPTPTDTGNSATAIVLVVVGILFALLAIAGVVIFLLVRRRGVPEGPDGEDPAYYGHGSQPGGYGPYGQTAYGATPPSGYQGTGQFGRSGFADRSGAYPGSQAGGVASWDDSPTEEEDAGPGPDWHPRPMTGHWRAPDASDYRPGSYDPGTADPRDAAGFAPPDPWANDGDDPYGTSRAPAGNYGASGFGPKSNLPPRGSASQQGRNPWGESWRDAPRQQSGQPRQPGNGDEPDDPNGYTGW